ATSASARRWRGSRRGRRYRRSTSGSRTCGCRTRSWSGSRRSAAIRRVWSSSGTEALEGLARGFAAIEHAAEARDGDPPAIVHANAVELEVPEQERNGGGGTVPLPLGEVDDHDGAALRPVGPVRLEADVRRGMPDGVGVQTSI